jgi:hypothetical protein
MLTLALAYRGRGKACLTRAVIICGYFAFAAALAVSVMAWKDHAENLRRTATSWDRTTPSPQPTLMSAALPVGRRPNLAPARSALPEIAVCGDECNSISLYMASIFSRDV